MIFQPHLTGTSALSGKHRNTEMTSFHSSAAVLLLCQTSYMQSLLDFFNLDDLQSNINHLNERMQFTSFLFRQVQKYYLDEAVT